MRNKIAQQPSVTYVRYGWVEGVSLQAQIEKPSIGGQAVLSHSKTTTSYYNLLLYRTGRICESDDNMVMGRVIPYLLPQFIVILPLM